MAACWELGSNEFNRASQLVHIGDVTSLTFRKLLNATVGHLHRFTVIHCHKWYNALMKSLTKAARVNTALQVVQHMNDGLTVVDACKAVGLPRSSFYYIMDNNPDAFAEMLALMNANNREQLTMIQLSKTEMLRRIIQDGLSADTKPKDHLAIYLKLSELDNMMSQALQVENEAVKYIHELQKQGPKTSIQISRYSATQTTIAVDTEQC
jgi:pentatricopeptide repeat protein